MDRPAPLRRQAAPGNDQNNRPRRQDYNQVNSRGWASISPEDRLGLDEAAADGVPDQAGDLVNIKLVHERGAMAIGGLGADA